MAISIQTLISLVSVSFAVFAGIIAMTRGKTADDKAEASQLTQVMIKLDMMSNTLAEIKADIRNVKLDIQELRERLVVVEQANKSLHHRVDTLESKEQHYLDDER